MTQIIHGDCIEKMKELPDNSVDSIVTDPPYELGFMGKQWDGTGIANSVEMWREALRVLKPGGHLLAFSGTRTYHRMAVAIEDAGFEVRDMIEWVYGSGFPKSLNIGKAVDKIQGNEREVVGKRMVVDITGDAYGSNNEKANDGRERLAEYTETKGTSQWEGWGTALKPAHEPICMARKPLGEKTVAENCLKWGTGGINIDESRVDFISEADRKESTTKNQHADFGTKPMTNNNVYGDYSMIQPKNYQPVGRFPANLIHDNSEEVRECFPNESERFFKSIIYQAKASKSERNKGCEGLEEKPAFDNPNGNMGGNMVSKSGPRQNNHPTVKPIALMEYLIKLVTPKGGTVLDPFMGSGSTGVAAKQNGYGFIGIDMTPEYIEIAQARINATL